jgi:hypothetical protein
MSTHDPVLGISPLASPQISEESSNDDETSCHLADSGIVMAEQNNHDVVNQTRSGGDLSLSDVPASTSSNQDTRGDVDGVNTIAKNGPQTNTHGQPGPHGSQEAKVESEGAFESGTVSFTKTDGYRQLLNETQENLKSGTTRRGPATDGKSQTNGITVNSESGYDSSSQVNVGEGSGGSDTDTSRTDPKASADGRHHSRKNSVKKPTTFKPVSFAKFSISKAPGSAQSVKSTSDKRMYSKSSSCGYTDP